MTDHINFTPARAKALQVAYDHAVETKAETLTFDGNVILTVYVKHLLEHMANVMPKET